MHRDETILDTNRDYKNIQKRKTIETSRDYYQLCFLKLYQKFQGSGKKLIIVIVNILPLTPFTSKGGVWDKCRINFYTLETSDTILKKMVYRAEQSRIECYATDYIKDEQSREYKLAMLSDCCDIVMVS